MLQCVHWLVTDVLAGNEQCVLRGGGGFRSKLLSEAAGNKVDE